MNFTERLLLCGLLQVTCIAALTLVAGTVGRRLFRANASMAIVTGLIAVVFLSVMTFSPWPRWNVLQTADTAGSVLNDAIASAERSEAGSSNATDGGSIDTNATAGTPSADNGGFQSAGLYWLNTLLVHQPLPAGKLTGERADSETWSTSQRCIVFLFLSGLLFSVVRVLVGIIAIRRLIQRCPVATSGRLKAALHDVCQSLQFSGTVELRECPEIATAATAGIRRPVILITSQWRTWTAEQLKCVLAHELAHISRRDFLTGLIAQTGLVLHFYHPLVHWLMRRLRLEQELAADAIAVTVAGGPVRYLHAIGELALKQPCVTVGWPAHSFLPTQATFLRRIEMLRDSKVFTGSAPGYVRIGLTAMVIASTAAVLGFRPQSVSSVVQATPISGGSSQAAGTAPAENQQKPMQAVYIPKEATAVIAVRAADIMPVVEQLKPQMQNGLSPLHQLLVTHLDSIDQLTVVVVSGQPDPNNGTFNVLEHIAVNVQFESKAARDAFRAAQSEKGGFKATSNPALKGDYEVSNSEGARWFPDDLTLIVGDPHAVSLLAASGPKSDSALTTTTEWKTAATTSVAVAFDTATLRTYMAKQPKNPLTAIFSALWNSAESHTVGVSVGDVVQVALTSQAKDAVAGRQVADALVTTFSAAATEVSGALLSLPVDVKASAERVFIPMLTNPRIGQQDGTITVNISFPQQIVMSLLTTSHKEERESAQSLAAMNSLKMLLLAMHNYHDQTGRFPSAVIVDPASKAARSWRVELLPYLDQAALYEKYKIDQPWDSPANLEVLKQMPPVFRHPTQPKDATTTRFQAPSGKGLIFDVDDLDGTPIAEIQDGTSNTFALVEAAEEIPWTKPEDVAIDLTKDELPKLGSDGKTFLAARADGSVAKISLKNPVDVLKACFTRAGGEIVELQSP